MKPGQTTQPRRGRNIVLVGFRCSGKNTVGEALAYRLGWPVFDTDRRIQEKCGQSIASLVEQSGWELFREMESRAVKEVKPRQQRVIITGGGVIERPENVEHLRRSGLMVFLEARMDDILQRMKSDTLTPSTRPGLTGLPPDEEVRVLLEKRDPLYRATADLVVNTSILSVGQCVDRIMRCVSCEWSEHLLYK